MVTCEECGALVDSSTEMLQRHSDWHDELVTIKTLAKEPLANPDRAKWGEFFVKDC